MKSKRWLAMMLAAIALLNFGAFSLADSPTDGAEAFKPIQRRWTNTASIRLGLSFSNGQANCTGSITGYSGTSKIVATFTLQRVNANGTLSNPIATWSNVTAESDMLLWSRSNSVSSGTYRLTVNAAVTRGSTEYVSTYTEATY